MMRCKHDFPYLSIGDLKLEQFKLDKKMSIVLLAWLSGNLVVHLGKSV